ncbi:ribosomal protein L24 [Neoconidiobolus thromboides FSU 785]|nr:ribosomal protein L24 [Neoconidiobolus thromboides FSU 785]
MSKSKLLSLISTRVQHQPNLPHPDNLIKKWNIIKGDEVMIISGKDKGEIGRVQRVVRDQNKLVVTGKNLVWKHVPKNADSPGGKVQKEMPIHYSNVMHIDPNTRRAIKVELRKVKDEESGKLKNQRFVKGTNTMIPRPTFLEYIDARKDGPYDTLPEAATKVTYTPTLESYPLPKGVIDELRSPKRAAYDLHRSLLKLQKEKEKLQLKAERMSRPKFTRFTPGGLQKNTTIESN